MMKTNLFLKLFPFPDYLNIPSIGIDISDRSIKYVELKKHKEGLRLGVFGNKNIEKGIVEKGEIKKKDELVKHLSALKQEIKNIYVTASLPEEKAFLKTVRLPLMEEYQIRKSLEVQLEQVIPLSAREAVFDFDIIKKWPRQNVLEVLLSAVPKKIAEDYVEVFKQAGFCPVAFEIENQSIFRPLVKPDKKGAVMVIDFGKTRTSFLIAEDGFVKFSSTINVAGGHIDSALAKNLNLDILEAERLKKRQIIQKNQDKIILNAILPVISVIKDEAERILDYWQGQDVKEVILCGGDANMMGIIDYLSYELKKVIRLGNPWPNIVSFDDYIPEMEHHDSLMYVPSLGLALRSF